MTPAELKAYRISHGLTQQQLADKVGVNQAQISRWESSKYSVPMMAEILIKCWEDATK
jgi:transcriptional regulator with XRE-family HTH domain